MFKSYQMYLKNLKIKWIWPFLMLLPCAQTMQAEQGGFSSQLSLFKGENPHFSYILPQKGLQPLKKRYNFCIKNASLWGKLKCLCSYEPIQKWMKPVHAVHPSFLVFRVHWRVYIQKTQRVLKKIYDSSVSEWMLWFCSHLAEKTTEPSPFSLVTGMNSSFSKPQFSDCRALVASSMTSNAYEQMDIVRKPSDPDEKNNVENAAPDLDSNERRSQNAEWHISFTGTVDILKQNPQLLTTAAEWVQKGTLIIDCIDTYPNIQNTRDFLLYAVTHPRQTGRYINDVRVRIFGMSRWEGTKMLLKLCRPRLTQLINKGASSIQELKQWAPQPNKVIEKCVNSIQEQVDWVQEYSIDFSNFFNSFLLFFQTPRNWDCRKGFLLSETKNESLPRVINNAVDCFSETPSEILEPLSCWNVTLSVCFTKTCRYFQQVGSTLLFGEMHANKESLGVFTLKWIGNWKFFLCNNNSLLNFFTHSL